MQIEMKKLVREMSQFKTGKGGSIQDDYQKLARHTRRLNVLNQQARLRLQLTAIATS